MVVLYYSRCDGGLPHCVPPPFSLHPTDKHGITAAAESVATRFALGSRPRVAPPVSQKWWFSVRFVVAVKNSWTLRQAAQLQFWCSLSRAAGGPKHSVAALIALGTPISSVGFAPRHYHQKGPGPCQFGIDRSGATPHRYAPARAMAQKHRSPKSLTLKLGVDPSYSP